MEKLEPSYKMPTLEKYGTNLTTLAKEGKLDPVIGRKEEIKRVIQVLCKRRKNNPCLIGEPGVGKTVIAEGLALLIVNAEISPKLQGKTVVSIDMARLLAGTSGRGEFEERLISVVDEVKASEGGIILFIDEVHTLVGARSGSNAVDAANILKPALARGELKCIGATTLDEYKKYIEKDAALERRFQSVKVHEPSIEETIQILEGLRQRYEKHHIVKYADMALVSAAKLSKRYISDRFLPDKAIDLIDEAGSVVHLRETWVSGPFPFVKEQDIQQLVSSWTGIPVEKVSKEDSERLLRIEEILHENIIGQNKAINAIGRAIRRSCAGMRDLRRPISSFLFTGPTGVGKTEVANVLAIEYFGSKDAMIRLDMSEFYERHTVAKLVGSPPGYIGYEEGGQLTEIVRRRPHSLILFDEIEKAHRDVFNIMLQILDDGRLTDNKGRTVDFKNTLIIMTSNVGSNVVGKGGKQSTQVKTAVAEELKKVFRAEFLNRLDEVIVFHELTKTEVIKIVDIMLKEVSERLKEKNIKLLVHEKVKEKVAEEGYSPIYGARPLRRAIMRLLEDSLALEILKGKINDGDSVVVDIDSNGEVSVLVNTQSWKVFRLISFFSPWCMSVITRSWKFKTS